MKLRRVLAVRADKTSRKNPSKMGKQGVTWAGLVARLIYPNILQVRTAEREVFYCVRNKWKDDYK